MKKIFNRVFAAFLVVVLTASAVCLPASATGFSDMDSVAQWDAKFDNITAQISVSLLKAYCLTAGISTDTAAKDVTWSLFNTAVTGSGTGEVSLDRLNDICTVYNGYFNKSVKQSLFSFKDYASNLAGQAVASLLGLPGINFSVEKHSGSGLYRIKENSTGLWVVNSSGLYPYCEGGSQAPTSGGNQWIGERSCSTAKVNMKNLDVLNLLCNKIKESGTPCEIRALSTNYKAIWYNRQYYCDPEGRPFVCYANEGQAAVNQDRPDTSVTDEDGKPATDETGTVINNPDNSTNIDLSGMTITLPNGDVQVADAVIYDERNKTYYIDSHDTTNYNITYNYSWTYYINYTSITYIGQTAEYDKKYEVYYELPDGRDSADLTAADLEQLDFNIDVVGYGRTADDTSLRSLYHFDGDTQDSSYWNYCTKFRWDAGASLTYMDAGSFNGALYLDENAHAFTTFLPSNIGYDDFTMQFRYYQSHTAAPQTDSQIVFYSDATYEQLLVFDGANMKLADGTVLSVLPTGQWNEICIERLSGNLYYYLNGVLLGGAHSDSTFFTTPITFQFGNQQQTFKYLDELRFVNKALYGTSGYAPTSVPFDTNLSLVLPDSTKPVADEYWSFDKTITPLESYDFTNYSVQSPFIPSENYSANCTLAHDYLIISGYTGTACNFPNLYSAGQGKVYTFSVVDNTGTVYSITSPVWSHGDNWACSDLITQSFDWGKLEIYVAQQENSYAGDVRVRCTILPYTGQTLSVVYAEVVPGSVPNTGHKYVTTVVPVTSYTKPTLAVRTDMTITSKQIGGPRPSLPTKGLVWALVEDGVIQSLQIYNGSAWEACDGRIFTGTRWIPYSGYNIITMKDFYDVADASGDSYEYIYTEAGFWNWWQKSWNAFTSKLFAALSSAGMDVSGGTNPDGTSKSLWQRIKDAFNDTLGALIEALFDLIKEVLKSLLSLATGMLQFFFGFLTDAVMNAAKAFFGAFNDNSLFDFFKQPPVVGSDGTQTDGGYGLPSEVGTAFTFISSVVMVLPPDIRSILFFGIAAMALFAVLKMVKA